MSKKNQFKQANVLSRKPITTSNEEAEYVKIIESDIVVFNPFHPNNQDIYEEFVGVISKIVTEGKSENGELTFSGMQVLKLLFPVLTNANFDDYTDEELEYVVDNVDMYLDIVEAKDLVMDYCARFLNHLERFNKLPNAAKKYYIQQSKKVVKQNNEQDILAVKEVVTMEQNKLDNLEAIEKETVELIQKGIDRVEGTQREQKAGEEPVVVPIDEGNQVSQETSTQDELSEVEKQIFELMQKRNNLKKRVK